MPEGLNQVFVNGTMMNGARFPNSGADPFKPTLMSMTAGESDITSAALNQTAGAWVGGIVQGWCGFSWTAQGGRISTLLDSTIFPMRPSRILEGRIFFLDIIHK